MRVALLSRGAYPLHAPGGMERAVHSLARALQGRHVDSILVTRPPLQEGPFPGEVVSVPWGGANAAGHARVLDRVRHYPAFSRRVGEVAARLVGEGRVQVVDAQGLTALGYGEARRRDPALKAPLVMNPQGMEEHHTRGLKRLLLAPLRRLSRRAAGLADRVVATDNATRDEVTRLLGVPPERVVVIPNGIEPDEIAAATPGDPGAVARAVVPALAGASLVLLSVGRLERYKGFLDTLQALRRLQARGALPAGWVWVVVGTGPDEGALRAAARGLAGVVLAGRVDEPSLHALYEAADVFVHATRFEGSSLVTLEAMAHGLPVVATRAGGIPDKVVDGTTGRLVAPGDGPALEAALAEVARDAAARAALGAAGRERAMTQFAWNTIVGRVLDVYGELGVAA